MQPSHKDAELKYRNIRQIAYELTMDELPYQDKKSILLNEITTRALSAFNSMPPGKARKVDWDWDFGVRSYRKRYPNRFELALWYNNTLCGLSIGWPSYNGTRVRLDFIERFPGDNNPLKGRITPIAVTAYEVYARLIDASQVRIMKPAESLVSYYTSLNYMYVQGTGTDLNASYYTKIRGINLC